MNKAERIKQGVSPIIGNNIHRLREQKHLRNMDIVANPQLEGIPISTSTLSKIEQGACNPTTTQLIALQKYWGAITATSSSHAESIPALVFHSLRCPVTAYTFSAGKIFHKVTPSLLLLSWYITYAAKREYISLGGIFRANSVAFQCKKQIFPRAALPPTLFFCDKPCMHQVVNGSPKCPLRKLHFFAIRLECVKQNYIVYRDFCNKL